MKQYFDKQKTNLDEVLYISDIHVHVHVHASRDSNYILEVFRESERC